MSNDVKTKKKISYEEMDQQISQFEEQLRIAQQQLDEDISKGGQLTQPLINKNNDFDFGSNFKCISIQTNESVRQKKMEEINELKMLIDNIKMQRKLMEEAEKEYPKPKDVLNVEKKEEKKVEKEEEDNPYLKKIRIMKGIIALLIVIIIVCIIIIIVK